jgi:hypothetical protein
LNQHRSLRGTLTSNIKDAVFSVFGVKNLPTMDTKHTLDDILEWKSKPSVRKCFENLHKQVNNGKTYMTRILQKVWPRNDVREIRHHWIAYAVTVCEILLDPEIPSIQITELIAKPRMRIHLQNIVSFRSFAKMMLNICVNFSFLFFFRKKY